MSIFKEDAKVEVINVNKFILLNYNNYVVDLYISKEVLAFIKE